MYTYEKLILYLITKLIFSNRNYIINIILKCLYKYLFLLKLQKNGKRKINPCISRSQKYVLNAYHINDKSLLDKKNGKNFVALSQYYIHPLPF